MSKAGSVDFSISGGFCCSNFSHCPSTKEKMKLYKDSIVYGVEPGSLCCCGDCCQMDGICCGLYFQADGMIFFFAKDESGETVVNCTVYTKGWFTERKPVLIEDIQRIQLLECGRTLIPRHTNSDGSDGVIVSHQYDLIKYKFEITYWDSTTNVLASYATNPLRTSVRQDYTVINVMVPGFFGSSFKTAYGDYVPISYDTVFYRDLIDSVTQMIKNKEITWAGIRPLNRHCNMLDTSVKSEVPQFPTGQHIPLSERA